MPISIIKNRKVSDESGYVYVIGDVLYEIPDSAKIYSIIGHPDKVYVEVFDMRVKRYALKNMSDKGIDSRCFEKMIWPEKLVQENDGFISINPNINGKLVSLADIIEDRRAKKLLTLEKKLYYLDLGTQLGEIIDTVHKFGYVIGALSPALFFVSDEGKVYSLLSYQFSIVGIDAFENPYYISPEWLLTMNNEKVRFTKQSDAFLYATVLFQLLTGKYPFASDRYIFEVNREELWELMSDGKSIYYWEDETAINEVKEALCDLPPGIEKLFKRTFDYCGNNAYDEQRPLIKEWLTRIAINNNNNDTALMNQGLCYDEL